MKSLLIFTAISLFSTSAAWADLYSDEECVRIYRDKALELKEYADYFNDQRIDRATFVTNVSSISAYVITKRAICSQIESPSVEKCVKSAKKLYDTIRNPINLKAVIAGNQTEVDYSKKFIIAEKFHNIRCRKYN